MFQYVSAVGIAAIVMTTLMVASMLYLVWDALGGDAHTPSPDRTGHSDFGDGDEAGDGDETPAELDAGEAGDADEPQAELTADGNSA